MTRIFVDTETTGILQSAYVVEIGWVTEDGQERVISLPYDKAVVEPGAHVVNQLGAGGRQPASDLTYQKVVGIYGRSATTGEAVKILQAEWRDAELVFNNPAFDIHMIRKLFAQVPGAEPTWRYHPVDVKMLLIGRAGVTTNAKRDQWLPEDVEPEPEVHNALDGARLVKRQFETYERLRLEASHDAYVESKR